MCIRRQAALVCALAAAGLFGTNRAKAQDNRVPVAETRTEQRQQVFYRPETVTEKREVYRTVYDPVTEYHWEARWRPFQSPNWAYIQVPHVRWQARVEKTEVPYTTQRWVAETRTVNTPYLALRFAPRPGASTSSALSAAPGAINLAPNTSATAPAVVARAPAGTAPSNVAPTAAQPASSTPSGESTSGPRVGGILRMDNDPPRRGRLAVEGTLLR